MLNHVEIPFYHRCLEAVFLIACMGYAETGVIALVEIEKSENDEGVPDVVSREKRAELPSAGADSAVLFLG
jgi:hypothetical protein